MSHLPLQPSQLQSPLARVVEQQAGWANPYLLAQLNHQHLQGKRSKTDIFRIIVLFPWRQPLGCIDFPLI